MNKEREKKGPDPKFIWRIEESLNRQHQRERQMVFALAKAADRQGDLPGKVGPTLPSDADHSQAET